MKIKVAVIASLMLTSLVTGCSSTFMADKPNNDSQALRIAKAAGIGGDLRDTEVPKDTVNDITMSPGYGFALAASGYNAPLPGISSGSMAAMNFTAWLLAPKPAAKRNSMFAWMPASLAGDKPRDTLADMVLEAGAIAATELGYQEASKHIGGKGKYRKSGVAIGFKNGEDTNCRPHKKPVCAMSFGLRTPQKKNEGPEALSLDDEGITWFFNPSKGVYSYFNFTENTGLDELEMLVAASKHLPEWVYFYVAPKKIKTKGDLKIRIPLIVNQGKVLYFIKEETS
ncbi:MAG: hypothetical protein KBT88_00565 [Gammaproteobacteria bacterium]|nr:hypothetical protein [Gammaproteobacteria bacterium]MBQ0838245.1 hypothetical protein [Gammaproteobacteria bacterium]